MMITAKFSLNWQGGEYSLRLHRELVRATQQSALRVQRRTKELLKESGKGATTKAGLNRVKDTTQRFNLGMQKINDLKQATTNKTKTGGPFTLTYGGNYTHHKQGRIDRIYWYGEPLHRWVQSSQPGTPPHKQTGTLQRSISVQTTHAGLRAKIGPSNMLIYGRIQELGGKALVRLTARPYLRPAFVSQEQAILFQFALAVQRAAK